MYYQSSEEYWRIIEEGYRAFSNGTDPVEVVDSYYQPEGECQLCGHLISNRFVIKNIRTGKTMVVGCRCVKNRVKIEKKWWDRIRLQREQAAGQSVMAEEGAEICHPKEVK